MGQGYSIVGLGVMSHETFSCVFSILVFPWALMSNQHDSDLIWV